MEEKKFYLNITTQNEEGKKETKTVYVSEEVYRAYKQPYWKAKQQERRASRCKIDGHRCMGDCSQCDRLRDGAPLSLEQLTEDLSEFQTVLVKSGGEKALRGITLLATKVLFTGFPEDREEDELAAYRDFAEGLVTACEKAAWVKTDPVKTTNERYTFRSWMNSIGMGGGEHAQTRRILMQRLDGNTAFRTEAQRNKAMSLRRKKKEEIKHETATEPDFIVLG